MNKTNYITLIILLCFSIVFVVYPIKTQAGPPYDFLSDEANAALAGYIEEQEPPADEEPPAEETTTTDSTPDTTTTSTTSANGGPGPYIGEPTTSIGWENPIEDIETIPDPGSDPNIEIGDTWTGPSGQKYVLKPPSAEVIANGENVGQPVMGTWEPVEEETPSSTTSSTNGPTDTTNGPTDTTNGPTDTTNGPTDTTNGPTDTTNGPTYTPPPANGCVLITSYTPCVNTCNPGYTPPAYTPPAYTPPAYTPPTPPVSLPCSIDYFTLPDRAWVGYPITGKWSASADCDDCDVNCVPYPACVWKLNNIGIGNIGANEYKFTLEQSGTYDYTLTCYGEDGIDERTKSATVKALNLPWWREIIPVLPGSLFSF